MKPSISVVVPVYKAEKWLRDCVDSILVQTLSDIEVLLVDDGSPDSCGVICDEYAEKDERVRVFHKENDGVSMARKTGVDNARADWISFVDADDTLPATALSDLYDGREGSDIVIGRFDENIYNKKYLTLEENRRYTIFGTYMKRTPWARLIARHLFDENTFAPREIVVSEDIIMNTRLAFANEKPVRLINKKVYNYNVRGESISHAFLSTLEYEMLFCHHLMESIPQEQREKYAGDYVCRCLSRLDFLYKSYHCNVWYGTPYYDGIIEWAKRGGYHIPLSQWIKLRTTNSTLLRLYMMCASFVAYRYKKLKGVLR